MYSRVIQILQFFKQRQDALSSRISALEVTQGAEDVADAEASEQLNTLLQEIEMSTNTVDD